MDEVIIEKQEYLLFDKYKLNTNRNITRYEYISNVPLKVSKREPDMRVCKCGAHLITLAYIFDNNIFRSRTLLGRKCPCCGHNYFTLKTIFIAPTMNLTAGNMNRLPFIYDVRRKSNIDEVVKYNIEISKCDWDNYETSWNFKRHPLISVISRNRALFDDTADINLAECYTCWENECNERFNQLKANEEELNRIFIDIYGLQDELTPEVEDKDVTVRKADLQRDIKSLVSYAVGCMFGRYSLDEEGLVLVGQPFEAHFFEASAPVCGTGFAGAPGASVPIGEFYYKTDEGVKKCTYNPDKDNIIPICDEEYFSDDIVSRFCELVKIVYGEKSLETNLDFIAKALGNKGNTSREVIRNYFLNDFFKDHCNTYSVTGSGKRPIYWLFDSGKQNGWNLMERIEK